METMRDRFTAVATDLLDTDPRIVLLLADIGIDRFRASGATGRHPGRLRNLGIREQLLMGVAAGHALEGLRPIVHSYAPFLVERAFEQVKLDLGHQGVGAILVSVGASHDWAAGGYTHHAPGDIACLSTLPGWCLHVPGHPDEAETLLRDAATRYEPTYLRLSDAANAHPRSTDRGRLQIELREPSATCTVIAVGPMLDRVHEAVAGRRVNLLYTSTVQPLDKTTLREVATGTDIVLVEPYLAGTSTAAVADALAHLPSRILALGVGRRALRRYGVAAEHDAAHGLDVAGLRSSIDQFVQGNPQTGSGRGVAAGNPLHPPA